MKIISTNLRDINNLQQSIVELITDWARHEKVPIPRKTVIARMTEQGVKDFTTINALKALKKKGYIRSAVVISNSTSFVLLRGV